MTLVAIDGENITVSTTAIGVTTSEITSPVRMGVFWLKSGGKIYHNMKTTPTAAGVTGDIGQAVGDRWEIWGSDALKNFRMVKRTGEADAVVAVQLFGDGAS